MLLLSLLEPELHRAQVAQVVLHRPERRSTVARIEGPQLGSEKIWKVLAYVDSVREYGKQP